MLIDPRHYLPVDATAFATLRERFGHSIAVPAADDRFEVAGVGQYSVDEDIVYAQVYLFDHERNTGDQPWRWVQLRTERRLHGSTARAAALQHAGEFISDILRADRIDEDTMLAVDHDVEQVLASADIRRTTVRVDGISLPAEALDYDGYRFFGVVLDAEYVISTAGDVAFEPHLTLRS